MQILSTVFGWSGTAALVLSFQCKRERRLFLCQMLSGILFVLHYGFAGDYTGMCMDGMCFVRSLMMISGKPVLTGKGATAALCAVIVALCVLTWEGIFSIFPALALLASTVAVFSANGKKIRIAQFFITSPSWMTYNIHVSSWPGVVCEALDMGSVLVYWIRTRWEKHR